MATVETHVIGVGTPDAAGYTTIAAWLAACPADLVVADKVWRGELMKQTFAAAQRSGVTTDATRYIELTTAAGASFLDDAGVRANPLRYDATKGASIVGEASYAYGLGIGSGNVRVSKIQFKNTASQGYECLSVGGSSRIRNCLFEHRRAVLSAVGCLIENCVLISRSTNGADRIANLSGSQVYNSTLVSLAVTLNYGVFGQYGVGVMKNCYVGGATIPCYVGSAPTTWTFTTNACSGTPPAGWTQVPFSTASFEDVTDGSHDLRLKSGSGLIDAGTADATYALADISGQTRAAPWDVGAWEYVAQATGVALSGLAQAVASASGTMAVGVKLTGAALSVATANGALSTRIAIGGAAAAIASASGNLVLGVVLSGDAIAKSLASGTLASRFALGGTVQAQTGASGTLAVTSPAALAANATAHAAALGTLTVQFALSGTAVAQAVASGTLSVGGASALAGVAQAVPAASGVLSVAVPLAGNAHVVAGVTGNVTTGTPLAGAAVAVAAAGGQLMVTVKLSGAAMAQAVASGGLSLRVPLSGSAIARANAAGTLSGGLSPYTGDTRFTVRARQRNFTVTHAH